MPPNLALTDSDLEGNNYNIKDISKEEVEQGPQKDKIIYFDINKHGKVKAIFLNRYFHLRNQYRMKKFLYF